MSPAFDEHPNHKLLHNYLSFMATHRGTVESIEGNAVITSEAPGFSAVVATGKLLDPAIIGDRSVRTVPWNDIWTEFVTRIRPRRGTDLVFMVREFAKPDRGSPAGFNIRRVRNTDEMRAFAETQALAFLGADHPQFEWWHAFMHRKAMENLNNRMQRFMLAYDGERPIGTLVAVYSDALIGLYAIATLPEYRRRGVCSALVEAALTDASLRGIMTATLQVMQESVAQMVYENLGFSQAFHVGNHDAG